MRISQIDVFQVDLPYSRGEYTLSHGRTYRSFDATIVKVTATETNGRSWTGWGESTPFGATYIAAHALGARAGIAEMAPHLIGLDPRQVDRLNDAMDRAFLGHHHAKTPIDVACWDIFGQSVGLPVCDLLGGSTGKPMPIISSIYTDTAEQMRQHVAECRTQGYTAHSIKVGDDPALDAARIEACLADRQPGEFFLVDANGGMTVESALRMLNQLPTGLDIVLEQPCATWRECVSLKRRTQIPILWDELADSEEAILQLISEDAADGIGLKISKNGGLTRGRRQRDLCIAAGNVMSVQDTTGSDIAFAAIVHLGQTVPPKYLRSILESRDMVSLKTADGPYEIVNGKITAPQTPGLGILVREEILGRPVATYA